MVNLLDILPVHACCLFFFSRSWKSSLDVTLAEDRFIWLIYWPCGSGGASPKHGGLIDPTVSQTSGLFVVNYRIKAFSGSSSRTVHVLALVKLVYFLASNEMTIAVQVLVSRFPCLFAMNSHSTHASNRDETKRKRKGVFLRLDWPAKYPSDSKLPGTRQVSVRFRFCLKKEPLIPCGLLLSWYTLLRF